MTVRVKGVSRAVGLCAAQALWQLPVVRQYLPRSATLVCENAAGGTQGNRPRKRQAAGWVVVALQANARRPVVRAFGAQVIHARALVRNVVRLAVGMSQAMGGQAGARCGS